jgi:hypothetical protein
MTIYEQNVDQVQPAEQPRKTPEQYANDLMVLPKSVRVARYLAVLDIIHIANKEHQPFSSMGQLVTAKQTISDCLTAKGVFQNDAQEPSPYSYYDDLLESYVNRIGLHPSEPSLQERILFFSQTVNASENVLDIGGPISLDEILNIPIDLITAAKVFEM